jgi:hypothetical protein
MDELQDLREKYFLLIDKRVEELDLPEEEKELPAALFVPLERELLDQIRKLKKSLGIKDDSQPPRLMNTRRQKRKCRKKGERGRINVATYYIKRTYGDNSKTMMM